MNVRLFKPSVGQEELDNIKGVFERAWMGLGPLVTQFEAAWKDYIGSGFAVGVNSGTAALHLAVKVLDFPKGTKVLVPSMTFAASATAALYEDLDIVFVDVDPQTLSISVEDLKRKYTPDCGALVVVHFGGHAAKMDEIMAFANANNLKVIEDCAHCAGGTYQGKKLGTWGHFGCFSFEEKKCMTTGDGGMLVFNMPEYHEVLRAMRWIGIDKDTWKREADYVNNAGVLDRHWYYEIAVLGYKYNMNDLMAAIGLAQLEKLPKMNARRLELIGQYLDLLGKLAVTVEPIFPYDLSGESAYWIFGIRTADRDAMVAYLKSKGVATGVHYMPLHMHPLFARFANETPQTEAVWPEILTLPLHADLTDAEVQYVVDQIAAFHAETQT